MRRLIRSLAGVGALPLTAMVLLSGCTGASDEVPAASAGAATGSPAVASPSAAPSTTADGESDAAPSADATGLPKGLDESDVLAGVESAKVKWKASGTLQTVPGSAKAPGKGKVIRIRVQVEKGVAIDSAKFADYVMATLNDKRSWTENGTRRFARTSRASDADITVVLASPQTSADMCLPLQTFGKLSCRNGGRAVLTTYRWVKAIPEYRDDHAGYRHYVVNHEVGHALGHGHEYCAGKGKVAPVMMQQTKGLLGCKPNPWPHP